MSDSLFEAYNLERENIQTLRFPWGFATYLVGKNANGEKEMYVRDTYIVPEERGTKKAVYLMDKLCGLAKESACDIITGSVVVGSKGDSHSMRSALNYGMKLSHIDYNKNMVILYKEL